MPDALIHPVLGPLAYNEDLGWFETHTEDGVLITVTADDDPPRTDLLDRVAVERSALASGAAEHASAALLDLKNSTWREDEEPEVTLEAFRSRLALDSVVVYADEVEFCFADGDLFWGHVILVSMDASGAFTSAQIAG